MKSWIHFPRTWGVVGHMARPTRVDRACNHTRWSICAVSLRMHADHWSPSRDWSCAADFATSRVFHSDQ